MKQSLILALIFLFVMYIVYLMSRGEKSHTMGKRKVNSPNNSNKPHSTNARLCITNRGEIVRSQGEQQIANYLDELGLAYEYEATFFKLLGLYPDFFLGQSLVIEYWGLVTHPRLGKEYTKRMLHKLALYKKLKINVISLFPPQLKDGSFRRIIDKYVLKMFVT